MVTRLCLRIIPRTLGIAGFLPLYIVLLLLTIPPMNFKLSLQILKIYLLMSKVKILLQYLLQVVLMHTHSFRGQMETTPDGTEIEELITKLISEPTNFEPHKNPSCIDLVATDQPNIILDGGTRASLDSCCHHQIVQWKVNFRIPPPPPPLPFQRKIWHFNRANLAAIKRSMTSFPWRHHLDINTHPNWQVKTFIDTFLIMSNFIPNETSVNLSSIIVYYPLLPFSLIRELII